MTIVKPCRYCGELFRHVSGCPMLEEPPTEAIMTEERRALEDAMERARAELRASLIQELRDLATGWEASRRLGDASALRLGVRLLESQPTESDAVWRDDMGRLVTYGGRIATPAPTEVAPSIDVERLARALVSDDNNDPEMWDLLGEAARDLARKHAARLAAEYARLAVKGGSDG